MIACFQRLIEGRSLAKWGGLQSLEQDLRNRVAIDLRSEATAWAVNQSQAADVKVSDGFLLNTEVIFW